MGRKLYPRKVCLVILYVSCKLRAEAGRVNCACKSCTGLVKCACDLCVVWVCRLRKYLYMLLQVRTVRKYPYVLQCKVRILVYSQEVYVKENLELIKR